MSDDLELYRQIYLLRRFDETVLENYPRGVFYGTTHTYLGQEANAVGVLCHLQPALFYSARPPDSSAIPGPADRGIQSWQEFCNSCRCELRE